MRSTGFVFLAALMPLLLLVPPAGAGDDGVVSRLYEVGPLLQPDRPVQVESLGLPPAGRDFAPFEEDEEEPAAFLEPDGLVELVLACVPGGWDEDERASLALEGRQLVVRASPDAQEGVARLLAELWTEATRRVRLDGVRLVFDAAGRERLVAEGLLGPLHAGRADAKTRAALIAAAHTVSEAATVLRPGTAGALGRLRATSYVRSYGVEIAQDSVVADPFVDDVTTGWQVGATVHLLQSGDLYLEALVQTADLHEPLRRQPLEAEPFGTVDLPVCRVLRTHTAARLRAGESLLIASAPEPGDGSLEVLVLTPAALGERALRNDLRRFDLSALTAQPPRWALLGEIGDQPRLVDAGALNPPGFARLEPGEPVTTVDGIVEAVTVGLADGSWEDEGTWLAPWERAIVARHDPVTLATVERIVAEREAVLVHEPLHLRLLAVEGERADALATAAVPLPHGRTVLWQAGTERAYVADWEVEVAQEARAGDPQVATVFGGVAFELRLDPAPVPDRFALSLDLQWNDLDPRMETRRLHNECTGIVDVPRLARLDARADLVVARGATQRLDAGTLDDGRRLVVEITLGR